MNQQFKNPYKVNEILFTPYSYGWQHAIDGINPNCPYEEMTKQYDEYWEGYDDGKKEISNL